MASTPPANNEPPIAATATAADHSGQVIGSQDARQALKTGHMRWVLGISLVLAVVAMSGVWIWHPRNASMLLGAGVPRPSASSARTVDSQPRATPNPTLQ